MELLFNRRTDRFVSLETHLGTSFMRVDLKFKEVAPAYKTLITHFLATDSLLAIYAYLNVLWSYRGNSTLFDKSKI